MLDLGFVDLLIPIPSSLWTGKWIPGISIWTGNRTIHFDSLKSEQNMVYSFCSTLFYVYFHFCFDWVVANRARV